MPASPSHARRTDAGALQHLHRADGAGRQDHLAFGPRLELLIALAEAHARRALAVEQHPLHLHIGHPAAGWGGAAPA